MRKRMGEQNFQEYPEERWVSLPLPVHTHESILICSVAIAVHFDTITITETYWIRSLESIISLNALKHSGVELQHLPLDESASTTSPISCNHHVENGVVPVEGQILLIQRNANAEDPSASLVDQYRTAISSNVG